MTVAPLLAALLAASADWAVLGACLALAVAVVLFVFYIQPDASDLAPHRTKLDQLLERRDTIYDNLRDLRFIPGTYSCTRNLKAKCPRAPPSFR